MSVIMTTNARFKKYKNLLAYVCKLIYKLGP